MATFQPPRAPMHTHTRAGSKRRRGSEIFTKLRLPYRMKRVFIVHVPRSRIFICQSVCIRPLLKCCRLIYANQAAPPASICIILKNGHVSLAWKIAAFEFSHLFLQHAFVNKSDISTCQTFLNCRDFLSKLILFSKFTPFKLHW